MQITLFIAFSGPIDEDLELMTAYLLFFMQSFSKSADFVPIFPLSVKTVAQTNAKMEKHTLETERMNKTQKKKKRNRLNKTQKVA